MDVGSVQKAQAAPSPRQAVNLSAVSAVQRPDSAAPARPVATELDPSRSVTQVAESEAVRLDTSPGAEERAALDAAMKRVLARRTEIDEPTNTVVTRKVDTRSGEVVEQVPAEMLLKLRAYIRGVPPGSS
ncbi:hypothetical protein [Salinarimonas ramus]|uniref:Flagellar protein FlaG n=1 Tax=Salinarimonas ramus TaxID=690164 RepID=A0A917V3H1_9HYPH|nr:hypothetical protein [Salinarimonas ramus]GGK30991.1 hypothetical protein GCM10011322_16950 [Salinarimonas ramus]